MNNKNVKSAKQVLTEKFGTEFKAAVDRLSDSEAKKLRKLVDKPGLRIGVSRAKLQPRVQINNDFMDVSLTSDLTEIYTVYVNGTRFDALDTSYAGLDEILNGDVESNLTVSQLGRVVGRQSASDERVAKGNAQMEAMMARRNAKREARGEKVETYEDLQARALEELESAGIGYDNFFAELSPIFDTDRDKRRLGEQKDRLFEIRTYLHDNKISEEDMFRHLIYESEYGREVVGRILGRRDIVAERRNYHFEPVINHMNPFLKRIMEECNINPDEATYDPRYGTLEVNKRRIYNLPTVDEKGVFHGVNGTRYIPYHIGYFEAGDGSRIDRLRHIDPVESAVRGVRAQWNLTLSDVKFKTILDVSRNLPDFDNHPYGEALLEAYKNKVVLQKDLLETNSFIKEFQGETDDLGAVKTVMLDKDAKGLIDPYGTSNGANLGAIFYLTKDAKFNPDGTFTKGESVHSSLGDIMNEFGASTDNFNRNQMSYNALLTSIDVVKVNVCYAEFALWNSEDAVVMTKNGAHKMQSLHDEEFIDEEGNKRVARVMKDMQVGDKVIDMHGNKSVSSLIIDPDMDPEIAKEEQLEHAVKFAKDNPHIDMVVSPVSLASRLNLGVAKEGLMGKKYDVIAPDGTVLKDGGVEMHYMILPQTAEHKSKDYELGGGGRKYSSLFRNALASKVGMELYEKAFLDPREVQYNRDRMNVAFERLGVSFKDKNLGLRAGNINRFTDADTTIDLSEFRNVPALGIRLKINEALSNGSVNILLGDIQIGNELTGEPIVDSEGRNVLPVRRVTGETQPFRYVEVYEALSKGEGNKIRDAYSKAVAADFTSLTKKENLIKNLKTVVHKAGAKTEMIAPDPRLGLGEMRTNTDSEYIVAHRDPCLRSSNVITFKNKGNAPANMTTINPLMVNQIDGDFDDDRLGILSVNKLNLTKEEFKEFYNKSSVTHQLNRYGDVFLAVDSSHFRAMTKVNNIDTSNITFEDGKSNEELQKIVESVTKEILESPKSYLAYGLQYTNEQTLKDTLGRLADDGIKGNREEIEHHFDNGYTYEENVNVMKALIAKAEWTGVAGAVTNDLIAKMDDSKFIPELMKSALDIMHTMTQSSLQLKNNNYGFRYLYDCIEEIKKCMNGKCSNYEAPFVLKEVTKGLIKEEAVDRFCELVRVAQPFDGIFAAGVFNHVEMGNSQFAYMSPNKFKSEIKNLLKKCL